MQYHQHSTMLIQICLFR